jgi:hypothetical protein
MKIDIHPDAHPGARALFIWSWDVHDPVEFVACLQTMLGVAQAVWPKELQEVAVVGLVTPTQEKT